MSEFCAVEAPVQNIMLVGAGKNGLQLATTLEQNNYQVKLVEHGAERARQVAEQLDATIVLRGDAADEDLMLQ
jgi:trk system potassium uptake protein TrkA